jgi:hypothetical protein
MSHLPVEQKNGAGLVAKVTGLVPLSVLKVTAAISPPGLAVKPRRVVRVWQSVDLKSRGKR